MTINNHTEEEIAEAAWYELMWHLNGPICIFCKSDQNVDIMRIIPEERINTRFDTRNGVPACRVCRHKQFHHPEEFLSKLVDVLTQEVLEDLMETAQSRKRKLDYKQLINKLKEDINGSQNRGV